MAVRGQGARHDDKVLPRQTEHRLAQALVSTGFPYRSEDLFESFFRLRQRCVTSLPRDTSDRKRRSRFCLYCRRLSAGLLGTGSPALRCCRRAAAALGNRLPLLYPGTKNPIIFLRTGLSSSAYRASIRSSAQLSIGIIDLLGRGWSGSSKLSDCSNSFRLSLDESFVVTHAGSVFSESDSKQV